MLGYRALERITKGVANHRRLEILQLLGRSSGLNVLDVADKLHVNFKTISEHLRRLHVAGLVEKRNRGAAVEHRLSERGRAILKFLRTLE